MERRKRNQQARSRVFELQDAERCGAAAAELLSGADAAQRRRPHHSTTCGPNDGTTPENALPCRRTAWMLVGSSGTELRESRRRRRRRQQASIVDPTQTQSHKHTCMHAYANTSNNRSPVELISVQIAASTRKAQRGQCGGAGRHSERARTHAQRREAAELRNVGRQLAKQIVPRKVDKL